MFPAALNMPATALHTMVLSKALGLVCGAFCAVTRCHMAVMILR